MRIYFSTPQNTPYQQSFIFNCTAELTHAGFDVFLATDAYIENQSIFEQNREIDGKPLISDKSISGKLEKNSYAHQVFSENYSKLTEAEVLISLLDGSQVDDRVATEIGIFYGLMRSDPSKKGILGLATDARCLRRRDSTYGINIFTLGTLEEIGVVFEDIHSIINKLDQLEK